jgi:hypothetical protein
MESHQRVEQQEPGVEALEGSGKTFLIHGLVKTDNGSGDDVDKIGRASCRERV